MVTREELKGHWNEVTGRLKEHWGQLTDDDLQQAEGSANQLVGVVQQKTGATRREVEQFLTNVLGPDNPWTAQVAEAAQQYADEAKTYLQQNARRVARQTGDYSSKVAETVRTKPNESLAIAFGIGLAAGALFFIGRKR
ncbi:hypothetical protein LF1_38800 [Rubripirellula obstinata]|uniref:CsbD-like domain-containing protein n=1 Tax=Rubripirellula obstinata TaxID=406547 RepID=A0A5B1CPP3_9BACT|nr:CsbD family protein [Rubripirellula obstinata]KAA1261333.1 hypothetical protein LF1_38800 [Rubripirellula obstinata]